MGKKDSNYNPLAYHVLVTVSQDSSPVGYRLIDIRDCHPLTKELGYRAVAGDPTLEGIAWRPGLRVESTETSEPTLILEAYADKGEELQAGRDPVARMKFPISRFSWIDESIARQLDLEGSYRYSISIPDPDSNMVTRLNAGQEEDDDIEFITESESILVFPSGFSSPVNLPYRRVVEEVNGWHRCLFQKEAFKQFLDAAKREYSRERAWLGLGRVHLGSDACYVVIEKLHELPGQAGYTWMLTSGREWARLHDQIKERLVGYLHLHPRSLEKDESELSPVPSINDRIVAWNIDLSSPRPTVYPIAMFGTDINSINGDVAVHAYVQGNLKQIQLEVEE